MNEPENTLTSLLIGRTADPWTHATAGHLAGVFAPLDVGELTVYEPDGTPFVHWGGNPPGDSYPHAWTRTIDNDSLSLSYDDQGSFRFVGLFACGNGLRRIEGSGSGLKGDPARVISPVLPTIIAAVRLFDGLLRQHDELVKVQARVRQYRNEQRVLEQRQTELVSSVLTEHEQRHAQERELADRLEAEVAIRTEQLAQAKEQAERASKIRDRLLTNTGHELRTPLTAVLGYAELLLHEDCEPDERRQFLEAIQNNAKHLLELIESVLDLSRMEAGDLDWREEVANPGELVLRTVEALVPKAQDRRLDVRVRFDTPVPTSVMLDPHRFTQVIRCLVDNAIKFTMTGGVCVVVKHLKGQPTDRLVVDVTDTGVGIPADQISAVFEPFHQVDSSLRRQFSGVGLGLALAKRILELMGGRLSLTSVQGNGSTFQIVLPLEKWSSLHRRAGRHWPAGLPMGESSSRRSATATPVET